MGWTGESLGNTLHGAIKLTRRTMEIPTPILFNHRLIVCAIERHSHSTGSSIFRLSGEDEASLNFLAASCCE